MESSIANNMLSQREQVLQRQQSSGKYFLVLQGNFYRAYNDAAFALHRVTGYKVFQKLGAGGEAYYQLGFNMKQIDDVIAKIEQQGGTVTRFDREGKQFAFVGVDGSMDENMVSQPVVKKKKEVKSSTIEELDHDSLVKELVREIVAQMKEGYKLQVGLVK